MSNREMPVSGVLPAGHPLVKTPKIGVLLMNLGTPEATDYFSMRRYLGEFLSDRRVIEVNPILWQVVLNAIILTFRPGKSGKNYQAIWDKETNESPLRRITRQQNDAVKARFADQGVVVDWAMRYGVPSVAEKLAAIIPFCAMAWMWRGRMAIRSARSRCASRSTDPTVLAMDLRQAAGSRALSARAIRA